MQFNFPAINYDPTYIDHLAIINQTAQETIESAECGTEKDTDRKMMELSHAIETYFRKRIKDKGRAYVNNLVASTTKQRADLGHYGEEK